MASRGRRVVAVSLVVLVVGVPLASTGIVAAGFLSNSVQQSGAVSYRSADGLNATLDGTVDINMSFASLFPASDTVRFRTSQGNATLSAPGQANATIAAGELTGPSTKVTNLDVSSAPVTVDAEGMRPFTVGGDADAVEVFANYAVDDGTRDAIVTGQGVVQLQLSGLPADETIVAVNSTGSTIGIGQTDPSGNLAIGVSASTQTVFLQTQQSGNTQPRLSNPQPTGDLTQAPTTASVQVNDSEFGAGDQVTVDLKVDGQTVTQTTVTSNQTVSAAIPSSSLTAGGHTVSATATDSLGSSSGVSTRYFVPGNITIFNESAPTQQITTAQVTILFFDDKNQTETVINRTTTNGKIDLSGLPVQRNFQVTVEAPGYHKRSVHFQSIYDYQRIYLRHETNVSSDEIVFALTDQTGAFPPQSTFIQVYKPISRDRNGDGNKTTTFELIAGNVFGASGEYVEELGPETRYRVAVENAQGDRRQLGKYDVTGKDRVDLSVGTIVFEETRASGVAVQGRLVETQGGNRFVKLAYRDPDRRTENLTYRVIRTDGNGTLVNATTVNGPLGTFQTSIQVPASAPDDVGYEVQWDADRGSEFESDNLFIGAVPAIATEIGLDPTVLQYMAWVLVVSLTGLVVIFDDRLAALVGTVAATTFTLLGAIAVPPVALAMAGGISVLVNVARVRG